MACLYISMPFNFKTYIINEYFYFIFGGKMINKIKTLIMIGFIAGLITNFSVINFKWLWYRRINLFN